MPIIANAEIWFTKLNPKRPNAAYNKENPTWELQIRTDNVDVKKSWEELKLKPKLIVGKEGSENEGEPILKDGKKQWRVNLRKKSIDKDGNPAKPVKVVDGSLNDIDPDTIGNGSIGNIRIFQYEYKAKDKEGTASMPTAIQLTKHIVYVREARDDDFSMTDTERVVPPPKDTDEESDEGLNQQSPGDVEDKPGEVF